MLLRLSVPAAGRRGQQALVVESAGPCTWLDVASAAREAGMTLPGTLHAEDGSLISRDQALGLPPLVDGTVLTACRPAPAPAGGARVLVGDGPCSGAAVTLRPGEPLVIGRADDAGMRIHDPGLSRRHCAVRLGPGGVTVEDLSTTNGTQLGGRPLTEARSWATDEQLRAGSTWLRLAPPPVLDGVVRPVGDGTVLLQRGPRDAPRLRVRAHRAPPPVVPVSRQPLPVIAWVLPLVVSVALAAVLRMPMLALFGLLSPAMILGSFLTDRRRERRRGREDAGAYATAISRLEERVAEDLSAERRLREHLTPDLATVATQLGPGGTASARVWERRPSVSDAEPRVDDEGWVRLGLGPVPSLVQVRESGAGTEDPLPRVLDDAPVTVPVLRSGLTITGPPEQVRALAASVLGQLAVWHAPTDLGVLVLTDHGGPPARWRDLSLLPHATLVDAASLLDLLERRRAALRRESAGRRPLLRPQVLVLMDRLGPGADAGLDPSAVEDWGREAEDLGVVPLWLASPTGALPPGARPRVVVPADMASGTPAAVLDDGERASVDLTLPEFGWLARICRLLAPLRAADGDDARLLPSEVRLLDLCAVAPSGTSLADAWRSRPACTRAVIGQGVDGLVHVDLVRDGPHALIGGTTGSGKSELLQTLVASLALVNRPDRLVFVLVDYKGGAGFAGCAALPHTVGLVTDLDPYLADRALRSLTAELRRREHLFACVGATSLPEYELRRAREDPVVPRLVLAIDEFRILAEEMPDFLTGLVRIAAVGRSLGVHLVLATQRPGGIVSADIKANVNLRIALRMRDASDSMDVLETADAASLPQEAPGRALLRTGADPPVLVQTARVTTPAGAAAAPFGTRVCCRVLAPAAAWTPGNPPPDTDGPGTAGADAGGPAGTDLDLVARASTEASAHLGLQVPASPWLPALPEQVGAEMLAGADADPPWQLPWALRDRPDQQRQDPHCWDLRAGHHLAVVGGPRSGRSTAVRTVVRTAVVRLRPDRLRVGVHDPLDALGGLADLPHTLAVAGSADVPLGVRLLAHLGEEVARRRLVLAATGASSVEEHDAAHPDEPLGHLLHVVDGWSGFVDAYGELGHGRLLEDLVSLLRDGAAAGYRLLVTGDRALLTSRLAPLVSEMLCLRLPDPTDLVMAGVSRSAIPTHQPPGRAVLVPDGDHVQVAVGEPRTQADDPPGVDHGSPHPGSLVRLPDTVRAAALTTPHEDRLLLGLGLVDEVGTAAQAVTLARGVRAGPVVVVGPPRSGRTSAVLALARQVAGGAGEVLVLTDAPSRFAEAGLPTLRPDQDEELATALARHPAAVVVDEVPDLADGPADDLVADWWAGQARSSSSCLLLTGTAADLDGAFRGVAAIALRARRVLVLMPRVAADVLPFGLRQVPPCEQLPGRGILLERGSRTVLQVVQPEPR